MLSQVAFDGMYFQMTRLLRWIVCVGLPVALAGVLLAAVFIGLYFTSSPLPGFTTLVVLFLLIGGSIIFSTGVSGLHAGKIFEQVTGRPAFVVDERVSVESVDCPDPAGRLQSVRALPRP